MTLYIIGIGLCNERDITLRGLEAIQKCEKVYLENYTSLLQCTIKELEKKYNKKIIIADRKSSEQESHNIIESAKDKNIAFLVIGDPFSATTHIDLYHTAKKNGIKTEIIHNASILTAVGITGLQLYKFGKTTSIPFLEGHPNLETPYHIIKQNKSQGLHTLCLLDIRTEENRYMSIKKAIEVLEDIEKRLKENLINNNLFVVGCARLGCPDYQINSGKLEEIKKIDFKEYPHCLIIPGKLHFIEEEILQKGL